MEWKLALEIIGLIGGIATVLALFLAPMFYLGAKIDKISDEMHQENKDFHGRLERQDAEFKAGILVLNQKIKEKA